ncbi:MAG: penicillin acylase family protein [Myxococcota bacterium]|nr:penicillin acylase family protein [Myxococcota bacterium]
MSGRQRSGPARLWIALLLLGVVVLAGREALQRRAQQRALPPREGALRIAGLGAAVTVLRDGRGIPHLRARSERDALVALGYVHAQDRLAQMEWLRRSAQGRTAEVIGADGLAADRLARTLGTARSAAERAERLDPDTRRALEAYAAGVNARIDRIESGATARPALLAQLDVPLAPWTPADSIAVVKQLAWALGGSFEGTLVLDDLVQKLGGFGARPFFPPGAAGDLVPVPERPAVQARAPERPPPLPVRRALGLGGRSVGSSAWVVSGAIAEQGRPLLAADLHLPPTAPSLLYEAHWRAADAEVAGVTIPGAPVFWIGHNGRVAWAATEARCAVVDVYRETLDPDDPERYRVGSKWRSVARREERIGVRGASDELWVVRSTARGPLLGALAGEDAAPLALAWPGSRDGDGLGALLRAARARDAAEFRRALADHHEPALLFVYADLRGAGGRQLAGWIPRRSMASGLQPVPGRSRWYEWRERIPFDALPHATLAGGADWLIAADNPLSERAGEAPLEWWWRSGERARRIDALLRQARAQGGIEAETLAAIQRDQVVAAARERVRLALDLAGELDSLPPEAGAVAEILAGWDGDAAAGSVGAAAWHMLGTQLVRELLEARIGPDLTSRYLRLRGVQLETLADAIFDAALSPSGADALAQPGQVREALRAGLRSTGLALRVRLGTDPQRWSWGRLHQLRFEPYGWMPRTLAPPLGGSRPYGGNGATVAVGEFDPLDPFEVRVVSAYRFVVDLADADLALSALVPGSSEHPGDPLAVAGLERWLGGRPALLATNPLLVDETARTRLSLSPAP